MILTFNVLISIFIFQNIIAAQRNMKVQFLWPSKFSEKDFIAPPIKFGFLDKASMCAKKKVFKIIFRVAFTAVFKALKEIIFKKHSNSNIHRNAWRNI